MRRYKADVQGTESRESDRERKENSDEYTRRGGKTEHTCIFYGKVHTGTTFVG